MALSDAALLDRATALYAVFAALVMGARGGMESVPLVIAHLLLAVSALLAPRLRARGGGLGFLGELYPFLVLVGLYSAIGLVNRAVGVSHDAMLQGWEEKLFGGQPSFAWIRAQPSPALSWALHAGYLSFYFILAGAPLGLWAAGQPEGARRVLLAMMLTFYVCYAVFLVFPVAGPRYTFPLADNAATRVLAARFTRRLLENGAAWGTAFPSSHVAAALATAVAAALEWPALGAPLVVLAGLLTLGTVYGQFHYAVDAVAGAGLGLGMATVTWRRAARTS